MEKLQEYQGIAGRFHELRDRMKEKYHVWKEEKGGFQLKNIFQRSSPTENHEDHFAHVYRAKTRSELVRLSAAVMGIEFSYAAETAFVSPTLLEIGVEHSKMTMVWALSPLVGFFLTPILGSLSDKCSLPFGRRRPFILLLSIGILIGMILVPNGKALGKSFGDTYLPTNSSESNMGHPWGVFFTVLGTVLLDFDADACQSPSRAYLLDVTLPVLLTLIPTEDHARGLSTFTIMAGLGGFIGYAMGGFNWDETFLGELFGGHVKAVFSLITIIFIICVGYTVTSFREIPLYLIESTNSYHAHDRENPPQNQEENVLRSEKESYGTVNPPTRLCQQDTSFSKEISTENIPLQEQNSADPISPPALSEYLLSIIYLPHSIKVLCLTNLFCWMAHVCYSLNFTDYVGESVFQGNPKANENSLEYILYEKGVRFGCWGMSMYSLSCACYSIIIEKLIEKYKAKVVYVGGLAFYGLGMLMMAVLNNKFAVIVFSWNAGVLYSTLFTMPYLLIANYHSKKMFDVEGSEISVRGLGTDVAVVSSMVFLAQFLLSIVMGTLISWAGSTSVVVYASSILGILASICATQVLYLDL